jgi:hypothetical protein
MEEGGVKGMGVDLERNFMDYLKGDWRGGVGLNDWLGCGDDI